MSETQYLAPKTIDEAVKAHSAAKGSARFLAGGTDLLVQIKSGIKKPNLVIDIKKIVELNSINEISENESSVYYLFGVCFIKPADSRRGAYYFRLRLCVCLSTRYLKNRWTDFNEILHRCWLLPKDDPY